MSVSGITEIRPYLAFTINDEIFAIDVAKVRDVLDYSVISSIPSPPPYLEGIVRLRGVVVPVIDLRQKYEMLKTTDNHDSCILVLETKIGEKPFIAGVIADSVLEVFELEPDQINPVPVQEPKFVSEFLFGVGRKDEKYIMVVDIDKLFMPDELLVVNSIINVSLSNNEN